MIWLHLYISTSGMWLGSSDQPTTVLDRDGQKIAENERESMVRIAYKRGHFSAPLKTSLPYLFFWPGF